MNKSVKLLDVIMLSIAFISYCGIILLAVHLFFVKLALSLGLASTLLILLLCGYNKIALPKFKPTALILLLLLITLFFRCNPFLYVMGGQDQGLYVNMAAYFNSHHRTVFTDEMRNTLPQSLKAVYNHGNFFGGNPQIGGAEVPGVMVKDLAQPQDEFQFYPLHPIWMAIFAKLFGATRGVWALVSFACISVVFFSLICYQLSHGNIAAAAFGGILMALNPLHVFFSKFPVAEMPTMAFLLSGLYFLIVYWQDLKQEQRIQPFYLLLSGLLIGCTFFVRIDGFVLQAVFCLLFLLALLNRQYILKINYLLAYFIILAGLYALSVYYGLTNNYFYAIAIYNKTFKLFFGAHWMLGLLILGSLYLITCMLAGYKLRINDATLCRFHLKFNQCLILLIFMIIGLAMYRSYQFAYTPAFLYKPEASHFTKLFNAGFYSLKYTSISVLVHFLSYTGSLFFLYALINNWQKPPEVKNTILLFFIAISLFYGIIARYVIPPQYFFLRYFLPDALFTSLLLISLELGELFYSNTCHASLRWYDRLSTHTKPYSFP